MTPQTNRLAYGAIIAAAVLWGGSIVAQKLALSGFSAVEASVLRDIGGLAILLTTWWWQEGTLAKLTKADVRMLGLLGLGVLGNHLLILMGLKYVSGAVGGVIIGSSPVVTALLSALLIHDVPLRAVWAGGLLSFAGVGVGLRGGVPGRGRSAAARQPAGLSRRGELGSLQYRQPEAHGASLGFNRQLGDAARRHRPPNSSAVDGSQDAGCGTRVRDAGGLDGAGVSGPVRHGHRATGLAVRREGNRALARLRRLAI